MRMPEKVCERKRDMEKEKERNGGIKQWGGVN